MRGVVIFPNGNSRHAILQRDDGYLFGVKVVHDGLLEFMDAVEMSSLEPGSAGRVHNLTSDTLVDVVVQKATCNPTWDETIAMLDIRHE